MICNALLIKAFRTSMEKFKSEWLQWLYPQRITWRLGGRGRWRITFHYVSFVPFEFWMMYIYWSALTSLSCVRLFVYLLSLNLKPMTHFLTSSNVVAEPNITLLSESRSSLEILFVALLLNSITHTHKSWSYMELFAPYCCCCCY